MKDLDAELRALDEALRARGLEIWIGAEPTFTRPRDQDPCWLYEAEGGDKEARARALILALVPKLSPEAVVVRAVGRQFPEEPKPRFAYGASWPRASEGQAVARPVAPPPPVVVPTNVLAFPSTTPVLTAGPLTASAEVSNVLAFPGHVASPPMVTDGIADKQVEPPPPSPDVAWMTVTPDPAVVEVNLPPAPDLVTFATYTRAVYAAAEETGLSATRHRWNGDPTDSGGGGQITLGGPTPETSPFFAHPGLLAGLLRFCNRHPSLSFFFAPECVGSASQGPRPDEGVRERFAELQIALDRLDWAGAPSPAELWESLAPLLVDCAGNSHRAEVNVEKLWNSQLATRGQLGLVELRALRMEPTPERMIAVAALFRAVAARLTVELYRVPLVDWGSSLHELYALPWFLRRDLGHVLDELAHYGFDLGPTLRELLLTPPAPILEHALGGAILTITPAREFWPLVGDVASQERRGARVVDSSTSRLEIIIRVASAPGSLTAGNDARAVPLVQVEPGVYLAAIRYRAFVPRPGLHPGLTPQDPLTLVWRRGAVSLPITLHNWIPGGGAYSDLPVDAADAERRRTARARVGEPTALPADVPVLIDDEPSPSFSGEYTVDLRLRTERV